MKQRADLFCTPAPCSIDQAKQVTTDKKTDKNNTLSLWREKNPKALPPEERLTIEKVGGLVASIPSHYRDRLTDSKVTRAIAQQLDLPYEQVRKALAKLTRPNNKHVVARNEAKAKVYAQALPVAEEKRAYRKEKGTKQQQW